MNQASFFCPQCNQPRLFQSTPMNHVPHILAAVFLCGLWLPIWIILALSYKEIWRCAFCGFSDEIGFLRNPGLRQQQQIAATQNHILAEQRRETRQKDLAAMPFDTFSDKASYLWKAYQLPIIVISGVAVVLVGGVVFVAIQSPSNQSRNTIANKAKSSNTNSIALPASRQANATNTAASNSTNASNPKSDTNNQTENRKSQTATVISENANIRLTPDTFGEVLETMEYGSTVEVVRQKGPWFQVKFDGTTGWMHGNTIRLTSSGD